MPANLTYPGVYIEEIPGGVRAIAGVSTSLAAFVGRARRGPVNEPVLISNYGEYERIFGNLWLESAMSFAIRDFFLNGGAQAVVVRLEKNAALSAIAADSLALSATDPGSWGDGLRVRVSHDPADATGKLFDLAIRDGLTGTIEEFRNLSIDSADIRAADRVLAASSRLVRVTSSPLPAALPVASATPPPGGDIWGDDDPALSYKAGGGADGDELDENTVKGSQANKTGIYALEDADLFNLLCIPNMLTVGQAAGSTNINTALAAEAAKYCEDRRALLIIDPPPNWNKEGAKTGISGIGTKSKNAAFFFPSLRQPNPLRENQVEDFAPCGAVAGVIARTDVNRGIWKAPAGLEAVLNGVPALSVKLTDMEVGELNPLGINCLRAKPPAGRVVWGARTLQGDDRLASEWKYISVRRLALYIEESLFRGSQWIVFEPNDEPLWAQIRLNFGGFMQNLFRLGAFQGQKPAQAYFVKCDRETTTPEDIARGVVNIVVGFAPLKPAEFVIIKLQQMTAET